MPNPTQHHTSGRVRRRRSHQALKKTNLVSCSKCGAAKMMHRYCPSCGFYKDKEVVDVLAALSKKEQKNRKKELEKEKE